MGYWIIVILIVLGGMLVLLAAASVGTDDDDEVPMPASAQSADASASRPRRGAVLNARVPVFLFVPRSWNQPGPLRFAPELDGVTTLVEVVESSMLAGLAAGIESTAHNLHDSVVTLLYGSDDYLAGQQLESVLDQLERLLERLRVLPSMAIVGSIPDIVSAPEIYSTGVSSETLSTTIAIWNQAIAEVANSFSAEFVDLSAVPVELIDLNGGSTEQRVTVRPDQTKLTAALAPAIRRAVERVRSCQAYS